MFKKYVLAAFAFVALAANATGVVDLRIYHSSTAADSWPKTLEALTILKVVEGDQVKVEGLLDFPCHAVDWKEEGICSDKAVKAAHIAALKSRNPALHGEFISLKELQALGQSQEGINLPVSPAFKAKVDAPVVKTAAAAQPQALAPAPTVALATVSAASAPATAEVELGQVTKWAKLTQENNAQLSAQAAQVKDQVAALAALKTQIGKKEARVATLEQQLKDATVAGSAKASALEADLQTAKEELSHQRQEAKQAAARLQTIEGDLEQVEGGLTVANADIHKGAWWLVGLTLVVTLAIIGLVVNWRRTTSTAQAVKVVKERVEDVAEKAGVQGPDLFDKRELKLILSALQVGETYPMELLLEGETKLILFERVSTDKVMPHGIKGQVNPVKITNVTGCLYGAISRGDVIGVSASPVHLRAAA